MKKRILAAHRAVTLTELLVVLAILSLLATIAVPVYVQKTEQARRATARAEVRNIAAAEEAVAITHGFFLPIHLLDNLPNNINETAERDDWDNYATAGASQVFMINPFVSLKDQEGGTGQPSIADGINGNDTRAAALINFWSGPFLNPQRVATRGDNPSTAQFWAHDLVLDPWGRPYVFYSPIGRLASDERLDLRDYDINVDGIEIDDGIVQDSDGGIDDPFDRYAIVSFGANGQLDANDLGVVGIVPDDIFYTFSAPFNETSFNAL